MPRYFNANPESGILVSFKILNTTDAPRYLPATILDWELEFGSNSSLDCWEGRYMGLVSWKKWIWKIGVCCREWLQTRGLLFQRWPCVMDWPGKWFWSQLQQSLMSGWLIWFDSIKNDEQAWWTFKLSVILMQIFVTVMLRMRRSHCERLRIGARIGCDLLEWDSLANLMWPHGGMDYQTWSTLIVNPTHPSPFTGQVRAEWHLEK